MSRSSVNVTLSNLTTRTLILVSEVLEKGSWVNYPASTITPHASASWTCQLDIGHLTIVGEVNYQIDDQDHLHLQWSAPVVGNIDFKVELAQGIFSIDQERDEESDDICLNIKIREIDVTIIKESTEEENNT